jgi:hypothetical protein
MKERSRSRRVDALRERGGRVASGKTGTLDIALRWFGVRSVKSVGSGWRNKIIQGLFAAVSAERLQQNGLTYELSEKSSRK